VLASATFDETGTAKRPSVQVGDPFAEKVLIECCLEIFAAGLVVGIQDLGAAGLSCATTELAAAGTGGMEVDLDLVPLRDATLAPEEILMSESQERMMAVVAPENVAAFLDVCARWDVTATVIGTVTDVTPQEAARGGRLRMSWRGETIVDVPPRTLAHEGPVYQRPYQRPDWQDALQADVPSADRLPRPRSGDELRDTLLRLLASPNLADASWVTSQYDRYVLGGTVLAQPEDAGMVRLDRTLLASAGDQSDDAHRYTPAAGRGIALATDGNGRYTMLDPYQGARLALAEAYRNVASTGARPLAVTNCLNFGSPEDPAVMWQFAEATRGLADACRELGLPVTGGNVSFYNQTDDQRGTTTAIHPTPVIGVLGVIDDVARRTPMGLGRDGDELLLLGDTGDEFGGSAWAQVVHGHLGGLPPRADLARERDLAEALLTGAADDMLGAAHDLSDGGLAQALVEMCLRGGRGATITLPEALLASAGDACAALFGESAGRALVAVAPAVVPTFGALCDRLRLPWLRLGTTGGDAVEVTGLFTVPLAELRAAHTGTLPALFDAGSAEAMASAG
jgi:phosphoribosylformylglycinamidine synthase II